jgi:transcriptional regulator of heat shock response
MQERTEDILLKTIEEYIKSGEPVSSQLLFKRYGFGIKPARIRAELNILEDEGWLSQPYTSGGRVPTDRAYERYANLLRERMHGEAVRRSFHDLAQSFFEGKYGLFVDEFADEVRGLSVGFAVDAGQTWKSGIDALFDSIDATSADVFREIAKEFEMLEERIAKQLDLVRAMKAGLQVFIGEKSPFMKSDALITLCDLYETEEGEVFVMSVHPKRTDYREHLRTFYGVRQAIQQKQKREHA